MNIVYNYLENRKIFCGINAAFSFLYVIFCFDKYLDNLRADTRVRLYGKYALLV